MAGTPHSPAANRSQGPRVGGGTPGGVASGYGGRFAGRVAHPGDSVYLWVLIALEVLAIGWLRTAFKRYHGG